MAATTAPRGLIAEHDKHIAYEKESCCSESTDGEEEKCASEKSLAASTAYFCTITCPGRDQVLELLLLLANSDLTTCACLETECVVEADFTLTRVLGGSAAGGGAAGAPSGDQLQLPACGYVVFCSRISHPLKCNRLQAHIFSVTGALTMRLDSSEWTQVLRVLTDIVRRLTGFSVTTFCSANGKNVLRSHRGFCFICLRLFTDLVGVLGHARYSHSTQLDEALLHQGPVLLLPGDDTSGGGGGPALSSSLLQILYLKPCYDAASIQRQSGAEVNEEETEDLGATNSIDMKENTKLSNASDVAVDLSLRGGTNGFYNNNNSSSTCESFIAAAPFCPKSIVASLPSQMEPSMQSATVAAFPPQLVLPPFLPLGSSSAAVAVQEMLKNLRGCAEHVSSGPVADCLTCRQLLISNLMSAGMPPPPSQSVAAVVPVSSPNSSIMNHSASSQQQQHGMASVVPRNSTKNLKCPKCNWHYKYAETLEIHLREKHPEQESDCGGSGRSECVYCAQKLPHPRLTRGETYSCGFKPYRCDICNYSTTTKGNLAIHNQSDKHNNNLLEHERSHRMFGAPLPSLRQQQQSSSPPPQPPPTTVTTSSSSSVPCSSPAAAGLHSDSTPLASLASLDNSLNGQVTLMDGISSDMISSRREGKKTVYRCELCSYETNVYRNLKIHVTSEKHLTNQNMSFAVAGMSAYGLSQLNYHHHSAHHLNILPLSTTTATATAERDTCAANSLPSSVGTDCAAQYAVTSDMSAASLELEQHVAAAVLASGSLDTVFQCNVCTLFGTDDVDEMQRHCHQSRQQHDPASVMALAGFWHCNLCDYKSNLKANFQLHCKTDKHLQRLAYRNHLREGGEANMIRFSPNTMTTVQIRCNSCNFFATSLHKLQQHVVLHTHEINAKLLRYLAAEERRISSNAATAPVVLQYVCYLCVQQFGQKLDMMKHLQGMQHLNAQQTRQAQLQVQGQLLEVGHIVAIQAVAPSDDLADSITAATTAETVLAHTPTDVIKVEKDTAARHELGCVCCNMVHFQSHLDLERHLRLAHNIESSLLTSFVNAWKKQSSILVCVKEVVEEQKQEREQVEETPTLRVQQLWITTCSDDEQADALLTLECATDLLSADQDKVYSCHNCTRTFATMDDMAACCHTETSATSSGLGFLCWKKGCNQYFRKRTALEKHFNEIHAKNLESALISGSEGSIANSIFRHRCSYCPLLFRCLDKFNLHKECHTKIAQANSCALCGKVFSLRQKLGQHLQLAHVTQSEPLLSLQSAQPRINSNADSMKLKAWKCDICGDDHPSQHSLQNHMNCVHHEVRGDEPAPKSPLTVAVCLSTAITPSSYSSPLASLPVVNPPPLLSMTSPFTAMAAAAAAGFPPPHGFSAHIAAGMLRLMSPQTLHPFQLTAAPTVAPAIVPPANLPLVSTAPITNSYSTLNSQSTRSGHGSNSRARTRIVGSKRKLLMDHFNLNNSPNDEEIAKLANETDLPPKVIKHWFRNTLFKERQKDNTCPYNFSVPPQMRLNLAEYERSGRVEVQPVGPEEPISEVLTTKTTQSVAGGLKRRRRSSSPGSDCSLSKPPVLKIEVSPGLSALQMADGNCDKKVAAVLVERADSLSDGFPAEDSCSGVSSPLTASEMSDGEQSELQLDVLRPSSVALNHSVQHDVEQYQHLLQQCYQQQYYFLQQQQQQQQHNFASFNLPFNSNLSSSAAALNLYYQQQQQQQQQQRGAGAQVAWPLYDQLYAAQQSTESGADLTAFSTLQRLATLQQQQQQHTSCLSPASSPQASLSNASSSTNHGVASMPGGSKRVLALSEDDVTSEDMNSEPANKRQRTNISSDQAAVLFQEFSTDPNPSRRQTEAIATRVGLTKRVVQVWFQNQRARERRSTLPSNNSSSSTKKMLNLADINTKKCRVCGAAVRDGDALRYHMRMLHPEHISSSAAEEQLEQTDGESGAHDMHEEAEIPRCHSPQALDAEDLYVDDYEDDEDVAVPPPLDLSFCGMEDDNLGLLDVSGGTGSSTCSSAGGASKRNRTNITSVQLRMLQIVFAQHRMPSMAECETLGRELHLHRRVVQVWFQNNRAKEKKRARDRGLSNSAAIAVSDNGGHLDERELTPAGCKLCCLSLPDGSAQTHEHLCSSEHLRRLHERARLAEGLSPTTDSTSDAQLVGHCCVRTPLDIVS